MTTQLPLKSEAIFLTDGGLETTLIFHDGIDLPHFAAFDLLKNKSGRETLRRYYKRYADLAVQSSCGFIFETPTWRASRDWGAALGYDADQIAAVNRDSVAWMKSVRAEYDSAELPMFVSGNIGPRGDGYVTGEQMTVAVAQSYHQHQIDAFAAAGTDLVTAITMTYVEEAIGIVLAAEQAGLPCVIGFTTETDGRLPSGTTLREAITAVDAATANGPEWYIVNCAHFDHFGSELAADSDWAQRIRGIRANASRCSHAELDEAEVLDDGDPLEFGTLCRSFRDRLPQLNVFGGCCGTDHRHVDAARLALC